VGLGKVQIGTPQAEYAGVGRLARIRADSRVQGIQGAGIDLKDQIIQVVEYQIYSADCATSGAGEFAHIQTRQAVFGNDLFRSGQRQAVEMFTGMLLTSGHRNLRLSVRADFSNA